MSIIKNLELLSRKWSIADAGERANYQLYLIELAEALEVQRPQPKGSGYEFEYPIKVMDRATGKEKDNFIDLFKRGFFLLEAKDEEKGKSTDLLMRKAFGQAISYTTSVDGGPPPYVLALDVAATLIVWNRWTGHYGGFSAGHRIDLPTLHKRQEDIDLLRDVFENPSARDTRGLAQAVTKEIAAKLAELSKSLEKRGYEQEKVSRFLMRCVFTMFAEDVGLLNDKPFETAVREIGQRDPEEFANVLSQLWRAMDEGKYFGMRKVLRFNGAFFKDVEALVLAPEDIATLLAAAEASWCHVEPTIFGTLLTRALDPEERHRLGAEYTPREYVERVVRPTVEEPIRERWTHVQAEVIQHLEAGTKIGRERAISSLRDFHAWMKGLRFLDPACGSGNFLYVTMSLVKRIEAEVVRAIEDITGQQELGFDEVGPWQFYGIEVKPWAREIAELTLWIGYHQSWLEIHGRTLPPEPVLKDTKTLECRDAVLHFDSFREDPSRERPDPTPRLVDPVSGALIPDPECVLKYMTCENPAQANWPDADFIIGNPPYLGQARMRDGFGDGYVDALRAVYPKVPNSADFVMYWWYRAAQMVANGKTIRAGLITTKAISQTQNRKVVEDALAMDIGVVWAVANHPWVDGIDGADVRVAMTVVEKHPTSSTWVEVDSQARIIREVEVPRLNADLTYHADVASAAAQPLLANKGLSTMGFKLHGSGFMLDAAEAEKLLSAQPEHRNVIRPFRNAKDLTSRPRNVYVIDFGMRKEAEAQQYPVLYDLIRTRVKPHRDTNNDKQRRENWWLFGRSNEKYREAVKGLHRYIAIPRTAKFHLPMFLDSEIAPESGIVCISSDSSFVLGVLASRVHEVWAAAAGGRLGVGNDRTYNNSLCFDSFPFPTCSDDLTHRIAEVAERLDYHRKKILTSNEKITLTGIYNALQRVVAGEPLSEKERAAYSDAAVGVIRDLHTEIDCLVAQAYGWEESIEPEEILNRLVALHSLRVQEEQQGKIHWVRPEYQRPLYGSTSGEEAEIALSFEEDVNSPEKVKAVWPESTIEQIALLLSCASKQPMDAMKFLKLCPGATKSHVERHLETLAIMGELVLESDGLYHAK